MKLTRLILACTLLLLASTPVFALPECADCESNVCTPGPWSIEPCDYDELGNCYTYFDRCARLATAPVLADWAVSSIEIRRPEITSNVVVTPVDAGDCPAEITAEK
jgi:hypothetical protein